jgi:acetylornithine deacetylase/succinyl-diaminopimelate desuccinylase-like protein
MMDCSLLRPPVAVIDETAMIEFGQKLIQLPSYTGKEKAVAEELQATMMTVGFDRAWIDEFGNVIGEICGQQSGPRILFDGHIDTVEVSERKLVGRSVRRYCKRR